MRLKICNHKESALNSSNYMDIIKNFKDILTKINKLENETERLAQNEYFSTNPFAFNRNKTYVWVEKISDYNHCNINFEKEN